MPTGGDWTTYPWGNATDTAFNTTWQSSGSAQYITPVWNYNTYGYNWIPPVQQITEKIESAMDWLRRRVTEVTDLAYAEV